MERFTYLAILAFIFVGSAWLEIALRTRVLRRWKRLLLSLAAPFAIFVAWDIWALATGHWSIDPARTIGLDLFGVIPIEEIVFFVVVPLAAILSLEAVRSVRGWPLGDEESTP
ncbi:MAG: lycopene cyclase domain-containing protein [Candidatus Nanopelagicales bacterium]|jgi:lycopene cyclase domain-containing protein